MAHRRALGKPGIGHVSALAPRGGLTVQSREPTLMPPASSKTPSPAATPFGWPPGLVAFLLFAATLLAYGQALNGNLLWDDPGHVTSPALRSVDGLWRIWTEIGATQQYYPVLHSAFWLEHQLWGDATLGYHLINVLLHAVGACLFAAVLRRLAVPGAWLAATIFALHPVAVESVAWITEQKNTLSLVFYLLATLAYLRFQDELRPALYAWASALFVCAILSKSVTVTLPAALLVVAWWRRGRLDFRRDVLPLVPWFVVGIGMGLLTAYLEKTQIGAKGTDFDLSLVERCLLAGRVIWFYAAKLLWPANLSFIYPRWNVDGHDPAQYLFLLGIFGLAAWLIWLARRRRGPFAAFLLFAGTLFPALGFVNVFPFLYSYVADHFQYLASLSLIALAAAGVARLPTSLRRIASVSLVLALGAMTWAQGRFYRDNITLYTMTIARNPACWMAHNNLSMELSALGRNDLALQHARRALQIRGPGYAEAENNIGDNLTRLGRPDEAVSHLERALQLSPNYATAHNNLGIAFMRLNRVSDGLARFERAIQLDPKFTLAHFNLALGLASSGRAPESLAHFAEAVRLDPNYAQAESDWGFALTTLGRFPEAEPHFKRALQLNPASPDTLASYGRALASVGRLDEAIARLRAALELAPQWGQLHATLGDLYGKIGRRDDAIRHYTEASRLGFRPN